MIRKTCFAVTLACAALAFADAEPATQPSSTQPATQPAARLPSPAELAKQIMAGREKIEDQAKVAYFDLTSAFTEKPAGFSWFGEPGPTVLDLLTRLSAAKDDASIEAVLLYAGSGSELKLTQAVEIADVLKELRDAGKKTFVYADRYDTTSYVLASAATDVAILAGGEIFVPGVGFETMFYKGAFDKLGVTADYVQIGEYKGAEEPFTRTEPTEQLKGELNKLVENYYAQIVSSISANRNVTPESVKQIIDGALLSGEAAKAAGWVDHLTDADGMRPLMKEKLGRDINLLRNYGEPQQPKVDFSNPFALLGSLNRRPVASNKPVIAVVYAEGAIIDGSGGTGFGDGESVGSDDIRRSMRLAARDEKVKAVVIRIDSPGGSALASEAMWQAVRRVAKDKPVIISIGSMAASGGYYLASAGDTIVADPAAIVGSIGVVGGKFVLTGLYDKLGLTTTTYARGQNAGLFSSDAPFDERQKKLVQMWMKNTYDQFTARILETRREKIRDIDQIARGRIFLAAEAKELGMVDQLGGLRAALDIAAERGKLEKGKYDVTVLPAPTTLADIVNGTAADDAMTPAPALAAPQLQADALLRVLPASLQQSLQRQIQLMQLLEHRPVVLMSPYLLRMK
ncbi:MAG TPA: signal peptide peptidase SppA [Tepidisphaeraceae bacterium]